MYHVMLAKSWTRAFCFRKQFSTTFHRNNAMDQEREEQYRVANALLDTKKKIDVLSKDYGLNYTPRLVAVSKFKPSPLIKACYDVGHREFGENYVKELVDKAKELPSDIKWHFIGHLQTNKCKQLLQVKNLEVVETVDSEEIANKLNKVSSEIRSSPLKVFVQVNTSGEESKSGINPSDCLNLVSSIVSNYKNLEFSGFMTIGEPNPSDPFRDFELLKSCKHDICEKLKLDPAIIELSMGMSADYANAMKAGSTNIRVGSTIFGARS